MTTDTRSQAPQVLRGRAPRKQRATRTMILDAARRVAHAEGWAAVTIRRVADELGYTSPLIYEHFRDKGDAVAAVLHEGFGALAAALAAAAARPVDPRDPDAYALAVAEAHLAFARGEPAVYQLMSGMGGVSVDPAETARGALLACEVGVGALEQWAAAAGLRFPDPLAATEALWCAVHGVACLSLAGRLDTTASARAGSAGHADALLRHMARTLLAGWRATFGAGGPAAV